MRGPGELKRPIGVAVDKEGNLYVADNGRNEVVVYDPQGNYLRSMGKNRAPEAKKSTTVGVAVYGERVYLLDGRLNQIQVLDRLTGQPLEVIGGNKEGGDISESFALPSSITVDKDGFIYVTSVARANVMKFDADGHLLMQFGSHSNSYGGFTRPKGIAVDRDGWIYVTDTGFSNVQVFQATKRLLGFFGTPGLPAGSLNLPAGIAVSSENLEFFQQLAEPGFVLDKVVFVANQASTVANSAISVYGVGEMRGKKK